MPACPALSNAASASPRDTARGLDETTYHSSHPKRAWPRGLQEHPSLRDPGREYPTPRPPTTYHREDFVVAEIARDVLGEFPKGVRAESSRRQGQRLRLVNKRTHYTGMAMPLRRRGCQAGRERAPKQMKDSPAGHNGPR